MFFHLLRTLVFLAGLLVAVCLAWAWTDSLRNETRTSLHWGDGGVSIRSVDSAARIATGRLPGDPAPMSCTWKKGPRPPTLAVPEDFPALQTSSENLLGTVVHIWSVPYWLLLGAWLPVWAILDRFTRWFAWWFTVHSPRGTWHS